nr:unnamed protein product [Callosobruchus chinensis]
MAKVFPYSSWPEYNFLSHLPAFNEAAPGTTFLAKVVIREQVSSQALIALPPGVLKYASNKYINGRANMLLARKHNESAYPALYWFTPFTSKLLCLWKCLTVSSRMSAFSNLECLVLSALAESRMRVLRAARLWLILARLLFSMSGLLALLGSDGRLFLAVMPEKRAWTRRDLSPRRRRRRRNRRRDGTTARADGPECERVMKAGGIGRPQRGRAGAAVEGDAEADEALCGACEAPGRTSINLTSTKMCIRIMQGVPKPDSTVMEAIAMIRARSIKDAPLINYGEARHRQLAAAVGDKIVERCEFPWERRENYGSEGHIPLNFPDRQFSLLLGALSSERRGAWGGDNLLIERVAVEELNLHCVSRVQHFNEDFSFINPYLCLSLIIRGLSAELYLDIVLYSVLEIELMEMMNEAQKEIKVMDLLVKWTDGSLNVVCSNDLKVQEPICIGSPVKMLYKGKWYSGTVMEMQDSSGIDSDYSDNIPLSEIRKGEPTKANEKEYESEDNIPLSMVAEQLQISPMKKNNKELHVDDSPIRSLSPLSEYYDSDQDPPFGICEARRCKAEVFSACNVCNILLCWEHFMAETDDCLRLVMARNLFM